MSPVPYFTFPLFSLPSLPSLLFFYFVPIMFLGPHFLPPLLPPSLHPHRAQVDWCSAGWPVIITVELDVSGGWCRLLFEHLTTRTVQDRTLPGGCGWRKEGEMRIGAGRTEERSSRNKRFHISWFHYALKSSSQYIERSQLKTSDHISQPISNKSQSDVPVSAMTMLEGGANEQTNEKIEAETEDKNKPGRRKLCCSASILLCQI